MKTRMKYEIKTDSGGPFKKIVMKTKEALVLSLFENNKYTKFQEHHSLHTQGNNLSTELTIQNSCSPPDCRVTSTNLKVMILFDIYSLDI